MHNFLFYQLFLIFFLSYLNDLHDVLFPDLKQLMFCKFKCSRGVTIKEILGFSVMDCIKISLHPQVLSFGSLNVGVWDFIKI